MSLLRHDPEWSHDAFTDSLAMQREASTLGFDWLDVQGVLEKVREEVEELDHALREQNEEQIKHELGDLFLALVNVARFCDLDPANVMREANRRFNARFVAMRAFIENRGRRIEECSFGDLNTAWDVVKSADRENKKMS